MKYRRKTDNTVEAITFDDLVEIGLDSCPSSVLNMLPVRFEYQGRPVVLQWPSATYRIKLPGRAIVMSRYDLLVIDQGELFVCPRDWFLRDYETIEP